MDPLLRQIEGHTSYFEDLTVGDRFASGGRTVTEADRRPDTARVARRPASAPPRGQMA